MMFFKRLILAMLLIGICASGNAQLLYGKITYERKTNLYKKFKDTDWARDYIKEADKSKVDYFELYFNDSLSYFKPKDSDLKETLEWATSKNSVYQNFNQHKRLTIKDIWGEQLYVNDTLRTRQWKITGSKRNICGYSCRKAIWQANDSTRLYAWYCNEIMVSTGPESFYGLPGAILGIATEDGGVIYFAKTVEIIKPEAELLTIPKSKKKIYTSTELRTKLEKDFGKEKWGKAMIQENFGIW